MPVAYGSTFDCQTGGFRSKARQPAGHPSTRNPPDSGNRNGWQVRRKCKFRNGLELFPEIFRTKSRLRGLARGACYRSGETHAGCAALHPPKKRASRNADGMGTRGARRGDERSNVRSSGCREVDKGRTWATASGCPARGRGTRGAGPQAPPGQMYIPRPGFFHELTRGKLRKRRPGTAPA